MLSFHKNSFPWQVKKVFSIPCVTNKIFKITEYRNHVSNIAFNTADKNMEKGIYKAHKNMLNWQIYMCISIERWNSWYENFITEKWFNLQAWNFHFPLCYLKSVCYCFPTFCTCFWEFYNNCQLKVENMVLCKFVLLKTGWNLNLAGKEKAKIFDIKCIFLIFQHI